MSNRHKDRIADETFIPGALDPDTVDAPTLARHLVRAHLKDCDKSFNAELTDLLVVPFPTQLEQIESYIQICESSITAWTALEIMVERFSAERQPLPAPLSQWVVNSLCGKHSKPRVNRAKQARNLIIVEVVRIARSAHVPLRESSRCDGAFEIVADELQRHSIEINPSGVAEIWRQRHAKRDRPNRKR